MLKMRRARLSKDLKSISEVIGTVITVLIVVGISTIILVYLNITTEETNTPDATLAWEENKKNDELKITRAVPPDIKYAEDEDNPYLVFKCENVVYYVKEDSGTYEINDYSSISSDAATNQIKAGDIITGFEDGKTYTIAWIPTNKAFGSASF